MTIYLNLHDLAAARGDGLRQEFLELLTSRQLYDAPNVEDISVHLAEHFTQAGPNPTPDLGVTLRNGILRFPDRKPETSTRTIPPTKRRTV